MKNLIKYIVLAIVAFAFTGCMKYNLPMNNEAQFVKNNVTKKINKDRERQIVIVKSEAGDFKKEKSLRGGAVTQIVKVSKLSTDRTVESYFSQYFSDVKIGVENDSSFLSVKYDIQNLDFNFDLLDKRGTEYTFELYVEAKQEGSVILKRNYNVHYVAPVFLNMFNIIEDNPQEAVDNYYRETFYAALLQAFKKEVEPDLLKALQENM